MSESITLNVKPKAANVSPVSVLRNPNFRLLWIG